MAAAGFAASAPTPAAAHPLGNFSVNHLNRLTFTVDRIIDDVIIDTAEIPTAQAESAVDSDGDGTASAAELAAYGIDRCDELNGNMSLFVDGTPAAFEVLRTSFAYEEGQAGLSTSRLECRLQAEVDLSVPRAVVFVDDHLPDRVGWHEINAVTDAVQLIDSPVPRDSVTGDLRNYPIDLLSSPLDVRTAEFDVRPGDDVSIVAPTAQQSLENSERGFFTGRVDQVQRTFDDLIGRRDLTLGVGLLAIGLALILGASHALLPGHGKTVMAAYIAGRQGSVRDAVTVGATVTGTHTGGVLLLGLALTLSTSLAGETVLGWLGVTSGVLVAGLGAGLLLGLIRHRGSGGLRHGHSHGYRFGHDHSHDGHSHHGHSHHGHSHDGPSHHGDSHDGPSHDGYSDRAHGDDGHSHAGHSHHRHLHGTLTAQLPGLDVVTRGTVDRNALARRVVLGGDAPAATAIALLDIDRVSASDRALGDIDLGHITSWENRDDPVHASHVHVDDRADSDEDHTFRHVSRRGLIGMGIAGGLVPSPSALIILLSAIALGRTWFGILLVIGYGLGMAGTLTAAGVLLVKVRDRYQRRAQSASGRIRSAARRWGQLAPYFTATLVLVVGAGLAVRSLASI